MARLTRSCMLLYKKSPGNHHEKEETDIYANELNGVWMIIIGQMQLTEGSERQAFAVVRSETVVACNIIIDLVIVIILDISVVPAPGR